LTVTSPPYDNLRAYNGFTWDEEGLIRELYRVTKPGGVVVWVVNDATVNGSETGTSFRQALAFKAAGFNIHDTMIYAKHNPPPTGGVNRYYQAFEYMFIFTKQTPKTFNPLTEPRRNICNDKRTQRTKAFTRDVNGDIKRKLVQINQNDPKRRNVWTFLVGGGNMTDDKIAHQHPAIFPEQLAHDHIISWSNPGDVVLDPFMGSGTTAVACLRTGRNYIGFELSAEYCQIAERRIADNLKEEAEEWML
jgi:site-specific DNA-methyltransferase (adenine-specific)